MTDVITRQLLLETLDAGTGEVAAQHLAIEVLHSSDDNGTILVTRQLVLETLCSAAEMVSARRRMSLM